MEKRDYILAETNWKHISKTEHTVAILPWGATEAHNYHLPYATDVFESEYVSAESAKKAIEKGAKVIVLPAVPFGVNTGQLDIKLCININPSTQAAILFDVVYSLKSQGFDKLVIVNSHGGNDFKQMIREIQIKIPSFFICVVTWFKIFDNKIYFDEPGDHAGEMETSMLLKIHPHLVRPMDEAGEGRQKKFRIAGLNEGWAWAERKWTKVTADTGVGNPKKASAEKGEKFLNDITTKIAAFLVELDKADINDLYE